VRRNAGVEGRGRGMNLKHKFYFCDVNIAAGGILYDNVIKVKTPKLRLAAIWY
jgi:hypothetical protein